MEQLRGGDIIWIIFIISSVIIVVTIFVIAILTLAKEYLEEIFDI